MMINSTLVMYRAWLWWAWAFKILSQARIEGLPKPRACSPYMVMIAKSFKMYCRKTLEQRERLEVEKVSEISKGNHTNTIR